MLTFNLLGQTVLSENGQPLQRFRSRKEIALLVYLAQTGQVQQRDFLADLLWESSTPKQALTNLRTVLARLRKVCGDQLVVTRKSLSLTSESLARVDSVYLESALRSVNGLDSLEKAQQLQTVLDTYQGEFLSDFHLDDAPRFNEWVMATRAHIHRQVLAAFRKLGDYAVSSADSVRMVEVAQRWLKVDALDEAAHALLIRARIANGNTNDALADYEHAVDVLRTQLDVAPSAELQTLAQSIVKAPPAPIPSKPQSPISFTVPVSVRHNLPAEYDQFFGRKAALREIQERLDQPWCRLVTIVGQGGAGKTRLSTTIARRRLNHYPHGVRFVELEAIDPDDPDPAEAIAIEIATILDLRLTGSDTPAQQLLAHLRHRQMLLVLDNFEHVIDGADLVGEILKRCEGVQMIVTSREVLGLRAEWAIDLAGLQYENSAADGEPNEAVDLFVARMAQQRRGVIAAETLQDVRQICRLVEGLPLAIELAAALTRHTTCAEIAEQLQRGFDALTISFRDTPQRHRSLHTVFDMSWQSLEPKLQERLARLSVFRGGFSAEAATQIADVQNHHLITLRDKSLIAHNAATGRYALHAVVRAYSAEKLTPDDPTHQKHTCFFLDLLTAHTEPLQKETPQHSIVIIEPDIDNVRLAWQRALDNGDSTRLTAALPSFSIYHQLRGLAHDAEATMQTTFRITTDQGRNGVPLATRAAVEQARFQIRLGRYPQAIQTVKKGLHLAARSNDLWAEGMAHILWGEALWRQREYDKSAEKLNHALAIASQVDSLFLSGWCHHHLGVINDLQHRHKIAKEYLNRAVHDWQTLGNVQLLAASLHSLGIVYTSLNDLDAAQQSAEEAYRFSVQTDDRYRQGLFSNSLSLIAVDKQDYNGSLYYLHLAQQIAQESGNGEDLAYILQNMGNVYLLMEEYDLAKTYLEKALRLAETIDQANVRGFATCKLGTVAHRQGQIAPAQMLFEKAIALARSYSLVNLECEILIAHAELLSERSPTEAHRTSMQAVKLAQNLENATLLKRADAIHEFCRVTSVEDDKEPTMSI